MPNIGRGYTLSKDGKLIKRKSAKAWKGKKPNKKTVISKAKAMAWNQRP